MNPESMTGVLSLEDTGEDNDYLLQPGTNAWIELVGTGYCVNVINRSGMEGVTRVEVRAADDVEDDSRALGRVEIKDRSANHVVLDFGASGQATLEVASNKDPALTWATVTALVADRYEDEAWVVSGKFAAMFYLCKDESGVLLTVYPWDAILGCAVRTKVLLHGKLVYG